MVPSDDAEAASGAAPSPEASLPSPPPPPAAAAPAAPEAAAPSAATPRTRVACARGTSATGRLVRESHSLRLPSSQPATLGNSRSVTMMRLSVVAPVRHSWSAAGTAAPKIPLQPFADGYAGGVMSKKSQKLGSGAHK